jgi:hypothetical protein
MREKQGQRSESGRLSKGITGPTGRRENVCGPRAWAVSAGSPLVTGQDEIGWRLDGEICRESKRQRTLSRACRPAARFAHRRVGEAV